jgi:type IV secretion system protein VirB11
VILEDTVEQCAATVARRSDHSHGDAGAVGEERAPDNRGIVVGEVRSGLGLLDAWATGASRASPWCTRHRQRALLRLDRLAQRANVPPQRDLIAEAIHVIAVLEGAHARRRVTDLVRVDGLDAAGGYVLHRGATPIPPSSGASPCRPL